MGLGKKIKLPKEFDALKAKLLSFLKAKALVKKLVDLVMDKLPKALDSLLCWVVEEKLGIIFCASLKKSRYTKKLLRALLYRRAAKASHIISNFFVLILGQLILNQYGNYFKGALKAAGIRNVCPN